MALTQARMIDLLLAAQDFQHAAKKIIAEIKAAQDASVSPEDAAEHLSNLALHAELIYHMQFPMESEAAIAREAAHFTFSRIKENERERVRQANQRRALGISPSPSKSALPAAQQLGVRGQAIQTQPSMTFGATLSLERMAELDAQADALAAAKAGREKLEREHPEIIYRPKAQAEAQPQADPHDPFLGETQHHGQQEAPLSGECDPDLE